MNPLERLKAWVTLALRQRVMLDWWLDLARHGHFGERFAKCSPGCDCIVCKTESLLKTELPEG